MGLDTVELVMEVEHKFDIMIPNEAAEAICTVGDLHAFIIGELIRCGRTLDSDEAWRSIVTILTDRFGIPAKKIRHDARIVRDLGLD